MVGVGHSGQDAHSARAMLADRMAGRADTSPLLSGPTCIDAIAPIAAAVAQRHPGNAVFIDAARQFQTEAPRPALAR